MVTPEMRDLHGLPDVPRALAQAVPRLVIGLVMLPIRCPPFPLSLPHPFPDKALCALSGGNQTNPVPWSPVLKIYLLEA